MKKLNQAKVLKKQIERLETFLGAKDVQMTLCLRYIIKIFAFPFGLFIFLKRRSLRNLFDIKFHGEKCFINPETNKPYYVSDAIKGMVKGEEMRGNGKFWKDFNASQMSGKELKEYHNYFYKKFKNSMDIKKSDEKTGRADGFSREYHEKCQKMYMEKIYDIERELKERNEESK